MAKDTEQAPLDLKWQAEDAGTWKKKLTIEVSVAEVDRHCARVCRELANDIQLPGFRRGKAPVNVVERRFANEIADEVRKNLVPGSVQQVVKAGDLKTIGVPKIDVEKIQVRKGEPLKFEIEVEVRPEFALGTYKGLAANQSEVQVFEEEVDAEARRLAMSAAQMQDAPADAKVGAGDILHGECVFEVDGQEVYREKEALALAPEGVIGTHAKLGHAPFLGKAVGETVECEAELEASFPQEEHRGKKAKVRCPVEKIRRIAIPEMTDELAKQFGVDNVAALREKVRTTLQGALTERIRRETEKALTDQILSATPFELPAGALASQIDAMREFGDDLMHRAGFADEEIDKHEGEVQSAAKEGAERELREFFILQKIAEIEKLQVEEEEIDQEIAKMAKAQGVRAAELLHKLEEQDALPRIRMGLERRKVLDFLLQQANITVVPRERQKAPEKPPEEPPAAAPASTPDVPEGT